MSEQSTIDKKQPCQVTYKMDDQDMKGTSFHFSERGMLVNTPTPAPLNKRLKLVLQFPGFKNTIDVQGEVVWTNIHGQVDASCPRAMGIRFMGTDREVERLLVELAGHYDCLASMYNCYYS